MPLDFISSGRDLSMVSDKDGGYTPGYRDSWFDIRPGHSIGSDLVDRFNDLFNPGESTPLPGYEPGFDTPPLTGGDESSGNGNDVVNSGVVDPGVPNPIYPDDSDLAVVPAGDNGGSAETVGEIKIDDMLSGLTNSASANDMYMQLYHNTKDNMWLEKYIDNLVNRENTASARDYETQMSNTAFSRMMKDIKDAGYNPWLALQSNGTSTPSVSASGVSNMSGSEIHNSKMNNIRSSLSGILSSLFSLLVMTALFK